MIEKVPLQHYFFVVNTEILKLIKKKVVFQKRKKHEKIDNAVVFASQS